MERFQLTTAEKLQVWSARLVVVLFGIRSIWSFSNGAWVSGLFTASCVVLFAVASTRRFIAWLRRSNEAAKQKRRGERSGG